MPLHAACQAAGPVEPLTLSTIPRVIGLSGFGRAGKDTVAEIMRERYGYQRVTFATPIYASVEAINPLVEVLPTAGERFADGQPQRLADLVAEFGWDWIKEYAPEGRRLLVAQGDAIRALDPQFWVRAALAQAKDANSRFVFTDCRFITEAQAVWGSGGLMVRVERLGVGPAIDPLTGKAFASEMNLSQVDHDAVLRNDADGLQALARSVDEMMDLLSAR